MCCRRGARLQKNNETFDEIYANVGVRSYTVTPNDGFSINGVPTPLRGVARHQDRLYKGNARSEEWRVTMMDLHCGTVREAIRISPAGIRRHTVIL